MSSNKNLLNNVGRVVYNDKNLGLCEQRKFDKNSSNFQNCSLNFALPTIKLKLLIGRIFDALKLNYYFIIIFLIYIQ